ncbi:hypothetical protein [Arthrobacter sp. 3Tela_A]|uniref:hypothetical protein n=1 Tax=Arthrobacter sp. 3Tela_A TaxID=3093743 RepID=UPI003BB70EAA
MSEEQNSQPDAPSSETLNQAEPVPSAAAAAAEPVRGKRRSRRSTSAPTRLRQAAELLHTAPATAVPASAPGTAGQIKQRSGQAAAKPDAADADSRTNGNPPVGRPSGQPTGRTGAGILPQTAAEDDPRAWGDAPEDSSAWLREQRPPHWG